MDKSPEHQPHHPLPGQEISCITSTLTAADVERFRADGYLLPRGQLFSPDKLDALEAIFNEHLAAKGDKLSDELDTPHFRDPRLLDFLLSDEVLDTGRAAGRPGHRAVDQPLHLQGALHRPGHPLARGLRLLERSLRHLRPDRHGVAGAGPQQPENGCMRVIPGSHLRRRVP